MYSIDPHWLQQNLAVLTLSNSAKNQTRMPEVFVVEGSKGRVGLVDISGPLDYRASWFTDVFGGTGYDRLGAALDAAASDKKMKTILMRVQSPGGSAMGATEMHRKIAEIAKEKRVVAFVDPYAFSAAYQLISAATEIVATPSGMVGSIGAYTMHVNQAEMLKNMGVEVSFIYAGEKKVDGNSFEPLSDRARADLQAEVNFFYEGFVGDVASGRKTSNEMVQKNFGQGGRVLADQALSVGMIDRILTFNELLQSEVVSALSDTPAVANPYFPQRGRALALVELEELTK